MISKQIIAIETSAVDIIYPEVESDLRNKFIEIFQKDAKGSLCLKGLDEFEKIVITFAEENNIQFSGDTNAEKVKDILQKVLGTPEIKAGGALANTFHMMANCKTNGNALLPEAMFYCTIGDDDVGQVFAESLAGNVFYTMAQDTRTMVVHIIPVHGNRFMIPTPSFNNSCDKRFEDTIAKVMEQDFTKIDMLMIGGYFWYTGKYEEFTKIVAERLETISDKKDRPTIVLSVASHMIAESKEIRDALERFKDLAKVIVCANAGEFRRLINKDSEWRTAIPANCLPEDSRYQNLKAIANERALSYASQQYPNVTFVVTNGEHGVRIASNKGVSELYTPPKPKKAIVNTVGAGDVFAGGYLIGQLMSLPNSGKLRLGFIAAEAVICQSDARLPVLEKDGNTGLLAYLDAQSHPDRELLYALTKQNTQKEFGL